MRTCKLEGCDRRHSAKGYCTLHYWRDRRGIPLDAPLHYHVPKNLRFDWAACGTAAQYRQHHRYKVPLCNPCRQAYSRYTQGRDPKINFGTPARRWTPEEDVIAMQYPTVEAAEILGRSYASVKGHKRILRANRRAA